MQISDILYYWADNGHVEVYDLDEGKEVWTGLAVDIPYEYEIMEVMSFEVDNDAIIFNISTEE